MPDPSSQNISEDAFFVVRDCRELFLKRLEEVARTSGVNSPQVIDAFLRDVGEAHDELASATPPEGFEQTAGLAASRISLVGNDDLEIDIRIGEIGNRLKDDDRIDHWRAQLRYKTLLRRPKLTADSNPVGVAPICRGLWAISRESGGNLEQSMERLDRLETSLHARLPEIYMELNRALERHRIEPAPVECFQRNGGNWSGASGPGASGGFGGPGGAVARATATPMRRRRTRLPSCSRPCNSDPARTTCSRPGSLPATPPPRKCPAPPRSPSTRLPCSCSAS